ncbi:hypothetical protein ACPPVW_05435 [Leifsonia sp. McL0607]|uniref:hypothetical protein n=1 Tax=Leifsonia sp. McL0607 TaxID=3415672 RepID=UPI003CED1A00
MRERQARRSPLYPALLTGSLVLVAGLNVGGSYALWNGSAPISETEVRSGTLTATVAVGDTGSPTATSAAFDPAAFDGMLPGEARSETLTVGNTGTTPFLVAASLDAASAASTEVSWALAPGSCAAPGAAVPLGATPQNVGSPMLGSTFSSYCLTVTLAPDVPADAAGTTVADFTLLLDANQYRP